MAVFDELDTEHASDTLEEIDPNVQRELVASLKRDRVAQLLNEMTPAQAADVLAVLPADQVDGILELLDKDNVKKIQTILDTQEAEITNFASEDFITFLPTATVEYVEIEYPKLAKGKDLVSYIYVTDEQQHLLGVIDLKDILLADDSIKLQEIMIDQIITLTAKSTLREAYAIFRRYGFKALPIVDDQEKMLGVVPDRDIMNLKHKFVE